MKETERELRESAAFIRRRFPGNFLEELSIGFFFFLLTNRMGGHGESVLSQTLA